MIGVEVGMCMNYKELFEVFFKSYGLEDRIYLDGFLSVWLIEISMVLFL